MKIEEKSSNSMPQVPGLLGSGNGMPSVPGLLGQGGMKKPMMAPNSTGLA